VIVDLQALVAENAKSAKERHYTRKVSLKIPNKKSRCAYIAGQ